METEAHSEAAQEVKAPQLLEVAPGVSDFGGIQSRLKTLSRLEKLSRGWNGWIAKKLRWKMAQAATNVVTGRILRFGEQMLSSVSPVDTSSTGTSTTPEKIFLNTADSQCNSMFKNER